MYESINKIPRTLVGKWALNKFIIHRRRNITWSLNFLYKQMRFDFSLIKLVRNSGSVSLWWDDQSCIVDVRFGCMYQSVSNALFLTESMNNILLTIIFSVLYLSRIVKFANGLSDNGGGVE
jgi:hypothetical protein